MAEHRAGAGGHQGDAENRRDGEGGAGGQTETRPQPSRRGDPAAAEGRVRLRLSGVLNQAASFWCDAFTATSFKKQRF